MRSVTVWVGALLLTIGAGVFLIEREYISGNKAAKVRLEQGKLQLERFDEDGLRKGIDDLTAVVAQYPESKFALEARFHLAEAYERLGMRDVALGKYRKLAEMPLDDNLKPLTRFKIAKLQIMRNYSDEGMNQLLTLLNTTPDKSLRAEIYLEIGKYYQRKGFAKDAQRNFQNALTENPDNREARAAMGLTDADYKNSVALHGVLDENEAGNKDLKKESTPTSYNIAEGVKAFTQGDYKKAVRLLTPAAKSSAPESEDALYYLGNAYLKLKEYRNAVHFLNAAVSNQYKGRDEAAFIKKGEAYYLDNKLERALRVFTFVRTHYPKGKYAQIAADWEAETKRMMGDKLPESNHAIIEPEDSDASADEDDQILDAISDADDGAAPRPKSYHREKKQSEELSLEDDQDVTP